jgi:hypothetical protein
MITQRKTDFVLCAGPKHFKLGDPYDFVASGVKIGDKSVRLIATVGRDSKIKVDKRMLHEVLDFLKMLGYTEVTFERRKADGSFASERLFKL